MHEVTIEGYIYGLQKDRFIVMAFNINKLKNIIATYGELNYVPLIDRNGIKVKYGFAIKMAKTMGMPIGVFMSQYSGHNLVIQATVKKNTKMQNGQVSTSLTLTATSITLSDRDTVTEYTQDCTEYTQDCTEDTQ